MSQDDTDDLDPPKEAIVYPEEILCQSKYDYAGPLAIAILTFIVSASTGNLWAFFELLQKENYDWFDAAVAILPAIILISLLYTVYTYLRWKKFGGSKIKLQHTHGKVGGLCKGTLFTQADIKPTSFDFTLTCHETTTEQTKKGSKSKRKTVWTETKSVRSQGYRLILSS